ncbi:MULTISPECIES: hypothetical protein [Enterobacterales]|uniref:hypothetical protein n=1 Tax=Enterobacterales TaxID=91347 RepID=UPI002ED77CEE
MNIISMKDTNKLSFPDFSVLETKWVDKSHCIISLNGAVLESGDHVKQFDNCSLHIEFWDDLNITCYDHDLAKWVKQSDELNDICEMTFNNDLIIRGFGMKTGLWVEYLFKSPKNIYSKVS